MRGHAAILCLVATLSVLPDGAHGEIARLRSGEHSNFTRIVLAASSITDWQLGRNEKGYLFWPGPSVTGYDLSKIFEKIPKTRITEISIDPDSGGLQIHTSCRCHASAYMIPPGTVVIDVRHGAPPANSRFETEMYMDTDFEVDRRKREAEDTLQTKALAPPENKYNWLNTAPIETSHPIIRESIAKDALARDRTILEVGLESLLYSVPQRLRVGVTNGLNRLNDTLTTSIINAKDHLSVAGFRVSNGEIYAFNEVSKDATTGIDTNYDHTCASDTFFDLPEWPDGISTAALLANTHSDLLGHVDKRDSLDLLPVIQSLVHGGDELGAPPDI